MAVKIFNIVAKSDAFLYISFEMLKSILDQKKTITLNEEDIMKAAMTWIKQNESARNQFIPEILNRLSLKDMSLPVSAVSSKIHQVHIILIVLSFSLYQQFLSHEVKDMCFLNNCHEMVLEAIVSKALDAENMLHTLQKENKHRYRVI